MTRCSTSFFGYGATTRGPPSCPGCCATPRAPVDHRGWSRFHGRLVGPLSGCPGAGGPGFGPGAARTAPGGGPPAALLCSPAGSSSSPTSNVQLYGDPDADLTGCGWDLVERYQLVRRPPGRDERTGRRRSTSRWCPSTTRNYLYGELCRLPARGDARRPRRRRRGPARGRRFLASRSSPRRVEALGPSGRGRDRRAAARRVSRRPAGGLSRPRARTIGAAMEFNLADLFEAVRRRAVPDPRGAGLRRARLTFAELRPARQPTRPRARRTGIGAGDHRRAVPVQRHRSTSRDARRVQAARRAGERQLPVRRGGAALPARRQ